MEQKKLLWIIAGVGVFLLVVLGSALVLYSPKNVEPKTLTQYNTPKSERSNGWISLDPSASASNQDSVNAPNPSINSIDNSNGNIDNIGNNNSITKADAPNSEADTAYYKDGKSENGVPQSVQNKVNELTVYADSATVYSNEVKKDSPNRFVNAQDDYPALAHATTNININTLKDDDALSYNATSGEDPSYNPYNQGEGQSENYASNIEEYTPPLPKTPAKVASTPPAPAVKKVTKSAPAAATSKSVSKSNKSEGKKTATSTVNLTVSKKAPSSSVNAAAPVNKKLPIKYWVQVTSLSSKKSADNARGVLESNKINADIFTYTDKNSRLFYRVRVGPYTTKSEAEYWKTEISKIDNFKNIDSYIAQTQG